MALVNCNGGKILLLNTIRVNVLNTLTLRLFKNNHTPVAGDTVANYTEADFVGYAAIAINAWGAVYLNGGGKAETDETPRTFTCTGPATPNDIYGYYVTTAGGDLVFAEANPAGAFPITATGQVFTVVPRYTLDNP